MLAPAALASLISLCAPQVHPHTMSEIIRIESKGDPLAINVNKSKRQPPEVSSHSDAANVARWYIHHGFTVDIGLVQLNSENLAVLGLSVDTAFEPCANIAAGARIISDAYHRASRSSGDEQLNLQRALSAYNTGSQARGFLNGYVARYFKNEWHDGEPEDRKLAKQAREPDVQDQAAPVADATPVAEAGELARDSGYASAISEMMKEDYISGDDEKQ